jgi:hypothetical protein
MGESIRGILARTATRKRGDAHCNAYQESRLGHVIAKPSPLFAQISDLGGGERAREDDPADQAQLLPLGAGEKYLYLPRVGSEEREWREKGRKSMTIELQRVRIVSVPASPFRCAPRLSLRPSWRSKGIRDLINPDSIRFQTSICTSTEDISPSRNNYIPFLQERR